jgi:hypothetical protein
VLLPSGVGPHRTQPEQRETSLRKFAIFDPVNLASPIVVHLRPTSDYQGQLLGQDDQPTVGHAVYAVVCLEDEKNRNASFNTLFPQSFEATRIKATTGDNG